MYKISPSVYEKADPALLELIERAQVCNFTDEELARYEAGLKALEDRIDFKEMLEEAKKEMLAKGLAEGIAKGIKETQLNTARKMLKFDLSIEEISEITGLIMDEISNLQ
jgi:predicted transposase/invertase (TIGR01784 family)